MQIFNRKRPTREKWSGSNGRLADLSSSDASLSLSERKRKIGYKHPRPPGKPRNVWQGTFDKPSRYSQANASTKGTCVFREQSPLESTLNSSAIRPGEAWPPCKSSHGYQSSAPSALGQLRCLWLEVCEAFSYSSHKPGRIWFSDFWPLMRTVLWSEWSGELEDDIISVLV